VQNFDSYRGRSEAKMKLDWVHLKVKIRIKTEARIKGERNCWMVNMEHKTESSTKERNLSSNRWRRSRIHYILFSFCVESCVFRRLKEFRRKSRIAFYVCCVCAIWIVSLLHVYMWWVCTFECLIEEEGLNVWWKKGLSDWEKKGLRESFERLKD